MKGAGTLSILSKIKFKQRPSKNPDLCTTSNDFSKKQATPAPDTRAYFDIHPISQTDSGINSHTTKNQNTITSTKNCMNSASDTQDKSAAFGISHQSSASKFISFKNRSLSLICSVILFALSSPVILSSSIPSEVTVTKSETKNLWIPEGVRWIVSTKETPSDFVMGNTAKALDKDKSTYRSTVYFCGFLPIKDVAVSVTDDITVVPGGNIIGINLKTNGAYVAKIHEVKTNTGKTVSPAKKAGLKEGDIIENINGQKIENKEDVASIVKSGLNPLNIRVNRNGRNYEFCVSSVIDCDGNQVIGIHIRDTVSGIGTVTFYSSGTFAALGHPICDIDTGDFVPSCSGSVFDAKIVGVDKGEEGSPGSLKGVFASSKTGEISSNSTFGIFGKLPNPQGEEIPIGKKGEIRLKDAKIICDTGNGPEKYDIEIQRIMPDSDTSKSMVIHITDKKLLEKTGGIVQGMSGSPIIQNGKLVGAVTHVFVNDPTRGYGIFIENMLAEAEKIK